MKDIYDLTIIGAGAAGLFASAEFCTFMALANPRTCCVLEKNSEPAKKIYATGNGRCNFLNSEIDPSFYNDEDFVSAVLSFVGTDDILNLFEILGVVATEEEDGRMYPRSKEAAAIARALVRGSENAEIIYGFDAREASCENGIFTVKSADGRAVKSRRLLITGGGKAGIQFGSDGSAMKLAQGFGHSVVKPIPALVPMTVNEDISEIAGVRCEALISLTKKTDSKTEVLAFNYFGEVQFTKDAVSGICVMDLSRNIRFDNNAVYTLTVDPLWDYDGEERRLLLETMPLENLVPLKLARYMQQHLKDKMQPLKFTVTGTKGWPDAQVTAGGVELSEVNPATMESKLVPGLYFAGEVINVDGPCGGYNLSFAFASGMLAADAIESSL